MKYGYEFRVVSVVNVSYVQYPYLVWTTLVMRGYVLTVERFHDYDEICPINKFLCQ